MTEAGAGLMRYVTRFPDTCHAEVSRAGECQPCDKTAVAVVVDDEDGHWWPACTYHLRAREVVPLAELLQAARQEQS